MALVTAVAVGAGLLVALLTVWCLLRASRLDRLHVRTDAARAALVAALERRAVVARAIAGVVGAPELGRAAATAEAAVAADREACENDLGRRLAALDRAALPAPLGDELVEAEHRVMLARRVHNDAVRDTRRLRSRRLVRWLRLAGSAPLPGYFEISEVTEGRPADGAAAPPRRPAGRVVLLDRQGRVLLFRRADPARPHEPYWFAPGGPLRAGEDGRAAAARELAAQSGVRLAAEDLVGPVWRQRFRFSEQDVSVLADEEFFVGRVVECGADTGPPPGAHPVPAHGGRWWTVDELRGSDAVVYPLGLGELLGSVAAARWDGVTRSIS